MKRFLIIVICVMLVAFGLASLLWAVGGNQWHFGDWNNVNINLGPKGKYSFDIDETKDCRVGDATSIRLESIAANIHVVPSADDTLTAHLTGTFSSNRDIDPPTLLLEKSGGSILVKVKYPEYAGPISMNSQLELTVSLPAAYGGSLELNTVSGIPTVNMPLALTEFIFESVSGTLDISDIKARRVDLNTTSGGIRIDVTGCEEFRFDSVSGDIIANTDAASAYANTTSGRIELTGLKGSLDASSISGEIEASFTQLGDVHVDNTSGSVTLQVPAGSGFSVDFGTASGGFHCDFPVTMTDTSRNRIRGTVGGGGPRIDVQTVSGGLTIFE